ncbi:pta [Wigglesworthia glossinidia endosymbiont of Glossina brevipalpis]|uniref:Phosphate acetyltransferase n=1 Tax=Wigglesworthia glossinidia brevipalpis TaxID=36870 RepID=Q8D321_WIGBR|nr:pta [Wigglesworthia glossinidia endosymbiont of Glossina brevipalpis]
MYVSRTIIFVPLEKRVGLNYVFSGIIQAIKRKNIKFTVFQPFKYFNNTKKNFNIIDYTLKKYNIKGNDHKEQFSFDYIVNVLSSNKKNFLLEKIVENFYKQKKNNEIVLIPGINIYNGYEFLEKLNYELAKILDAEIVLILRLYKNFLDYIKLLSFKFGFEKKNKISGIILNELDCTKNSNQSIDCKRLLKNDNLYEIKKNNHENCSLINEKSIPIISKIPFNEDFYFVYLYKIKEHFKAKFLNKNYNYVIKSILFCEVYKENIFKNNFKQSLLVISKKQINKFCLMHLKESKYNFYSSILIIGCDKNENEIKVFCEIAEKKKISVIYNNMSFINFFYYLTKFKFNFYKKFNDIIKISNYISNYISDIWISNFSLKKKEKKFFSPEIFQYNILQLSRYTKKSIILPEGEEIRILCAANICSKKNIAHCILLGNPKNILEKARLNGITIEKNIDIINPVEIREKYISHIINLRKKKCISEISARKQINKNIVLATLMLNEGIVDGLVSGATTTTADTLRPAFQFIKTDPKHSLISSIFFMLLPEQTLIYGDCAININPNSKQLSEIAFQSHNSAIQFGIDPKIAMISYSTGYSGQGESVEKVRQATLIAKKSYPKLVIDGPLQYDAATVKSVAKSKAPFSEVAGKATVLIFPELNTGNTTYKAVQRSSNIICIGPVLQGIKKPVNDLSRGASIDDIVYTIAITAIQSIKKDQN